MEYSPAQEAILVHLLTEGDDVPANISDNRDYHRNYLVNEARELLEAELIVNKGHGVYRLTKKGREEARDLLSHSLADASDGDEAE